MSADKWLGRAIAIRRTEMGLKRKDLHERAHLSYPYISEIENGVKEPSAKALRLIAEALEMKVADLAALAERMQDSPLDSKSILFAPAAIPVQASPYREPLREPYREPLREQDINTGLAERSPVKNDHGSPTVMDFGESVRPPLLDDQVAWAVQHHLSKWMSQELPAIVQREVQKQLAEYREKRDEQL